MSRQAYLVTLLAFSVNDKPKAFADLVSVCKYIMSFKYEEVNESRVHVYTDVRMY